MSKSHGRRSVGGIRFPGGGKTGRYAFFSSLWCGAGDPGPLLWDHGAGPVFAAVADGKVEQGQSGK